MSEAPSDKNSRSETPRTDALAEDYRANPHKYVNVVHENEPSIWLHARQLERELAEAKAIAERQMNDAEACRIELDILKADRDYPRHSTALSPLAAIKPMQEDSLERKLLLELVRHWREFGPGWGFDEKIESFYKAVNPPFVTLTQPSHIVAPEDYKQKYLLLSAQYVREVEQQEKRIEELEGAVRVESACREQAETALAKAKSARGAPIRECLETTNEHIGRLIHAFDGDRKELLRKLYKMNLAALDAPTDDTAKETK